MKRSHCVWDNRVERGPTLALHVNLSIHLCQQVCAVKDEAWRRHANRNPLGLSAVWCVGPAEVAVWRLVLGRGYCEQTWIWRDPWVSQSKALVLLTLVICHFVGAGFPCAEFRGIDLKAIIWKKIEPFMVWDFWVYIFLLSPNGFLNVWLFPIPINPYI